MKLFGLNRGYNPRRHPGNALLGGVAIGLLASFILFEFLSFSGSMPPLVTGNGLALAVTVGVAAAAVACWRLWRRTPLREPFATLDEHDPRVYWGDDAREDLLRRFSIEYGAAATQRGLYIAPYCPIPFAAETKNILVVGAPNSGKTGIIRALIDQSIERADRILILCKKGDMTQSFDKDEVVLIAPHHADSYDLDLAADIADFAAAEQFATDVVPESSPPFWSQTARTILTDIIAAQIATNPRRWNALTLFEAAMEESDAIREKIKVLWLNAAPLLHGAGADDEDKTVAGVLDTMRSAVFDSLRLLAFASNTIPASRRFSVRRWLARDYSGPRIVIAQFSSEYEALSTMVIGGLIKRIARLVADPKVGVDAKRRVVLALDEFDALGKIDDLPRALAVGREKGLVVIIGVQSVWQVITKYGRDLANTLFALFQIKIYGRLDPDDGCKLVSEWMGSRKVLVAPTSGEKAEEKTLEAYSQSSLAANLGRRNERGASFIRALVHCYGQVYEMEWPLTLWNKKRQGYIPAGWIRRIPRQSDHEKSDGLVK